MSAGLPRRQWGWQRCYCWSSVKTLLSEIRKLNSGLFKSPGTNARESKWSFQQQKKKSHKNYEVSLKSEKWHLKMYCSWSDPFGNGCLLLSRMAYLSLAILPEAHKGTLVPTAHLPELVSTLRGLLDVVRALVPLGVFWAALAAAASAAKFCNCIAFNPATSKERDQPHIHPRGVSYPLQQWQLTLAEG